MRHMIYLSCLAASFGTQAVAENHHPVDLPTTWKAMILEKLASEFPGGDLLKIESTTDASEIVTVCGKVLNGGTPTTFYLMVMPAEPPMLMPVVGGVTANLDEQIRAICSDAAINLD